jgi:hypothetical protein
MFQFFTIENYFRDFYWKVGSKSFYTRLFRDPVMEGYFRVLACRAVSRFYDEELF